MQCVFWREKATIPVDLPLEILTSERWGQTFTCDVIRSTEPLRQCPSPNYLNPGWATSEHLLTTSQGWCWVSGEYIPSVHHLVPSNHSGSYPFDLANNIRCLYTQQEQLCVIFFFQKGSDDPLLSLPMSYLDTLQKNGRACLMQKALVSCSQTGDCHGWKGTGRYFNARFKLLLPLSCLPSAWACWVRLGCSSAVKPLWDDSVRFAAGHAHLLYDLHAFSEGNAAAESSMLYSRVRGHWKAADGLSWAIKELCLRIHTRNSNCKWLTFGWALQGLQSTSVLYFHLILS